MEIFLAWSGVRSQNIAKILYEYLPKIIKVTPWMSDYTIYTGQIWFNQIMTGLNDATAGIICTTRENYDSHWLLYEAGALALRGREKVIPFLFDMEPEELAPLNHPLYQYEAQCYKKEGILNMVVRLNDLLSSSEKKTNAQLKRDFQKIWPKIRRKLNENKATPFPSYIISRQKSRIKGTPGCSSLDLALVATDISHSPFQYIDLIKAAKKRVLITGQNLYYLAGEENKTVEKERNKEIFAALNKGIKIDIMICNPNNKHAIETWAKEVMRGDKNKYIHELNYSLDVFKKWVKKANRSGIKGLTVKTPGMVPLSITFVDPLDSNNGQMVIMPATYDRTESRVRPCYMITKKDHPEIFKYYWEGYRGVFEDANTPTVK